jgi:hypothetical protein
VRKGNPLRIDSFLSSLSCFRFRQYLSIRRKDAASNDLRRKIIYSGIVGAGNLIRSQNQHKITKIYNHGKEKQDKEIGNSLHFPVAWFSSGIIILFHNLPFFRNF